MIYIYTQTISIYHYGAEKDRTYYIASDGFQYNSRHWHFSSSDRITLRLGRVQQLPYSRSLLHRHGCNLFQSAMVFSQILSPVIEKCFMRFECYRNKVIVVEDFRAPVVDVEPVVSEPMVEAETTSDTSEEVSTPMFLKPTKERQTFQRKTPHLLLKDLSSHQNTRHFVPMRLLRKNVRPKKSWIRFSHTQNEP